MMEMDYRRHRLAYSFRAWIDEEGSNKDNEHQRHCICSESHQLYGTHYVGVHTCRHLRLWDLNTNAWSHNIIRIVRRRYPFALGVYLGKTMKLRLQIGLPR